MRRARPTLLRESIKEQVHSFMERDDISRVMPGKNDAKMHEGEKKQVRVLKDYLLNIYEPFKTEMPNSSISFSLFCKLRPSYILLTSLISRNTCLCSKHQNFAMKLKAMRSLGLQISPNLEVVCKAFKFDDMDTILERIAKDEVEYDVWRRIDVDIKKKMRVIKQKTTRAGFQQLMHDVYKEFLDHVSHIKAQYVVLHNLKENLCQDDLLVQMDFAEKFTCQTLDEIQSAYWNARSVTLHPVVVYYREEVGVLGHKNFVYVSDINSHSSTAVLTILKKLMPSLKSAFLDAKQIHYLADSPSSQY